MVGPGYSMVTAIGSLRRKILVYKYVEYGQFNYYWSREMLYLVYQECE